MFPIEIYTDANGKSEINSYLETLKNNQTKDNRIKRDKIYAYMRILQCGALSIGIPYIKHIDGEIWELRPLRDRILFAYLNNNRFILLTVFMKRTAKTPKREIEKAKKILKDYKRRCDDNGKI